MAKLAEAIICALVVPPAVVGIFNPDPIWHFVLSLIH